jgi:hypothetical protein
MRPCSMLFQPMGTRIRPSCAIRSSQCSKTRAIKTRRQRVRNNLGEPGGCSPRRLRLKLQSPTRSCIEIIVTFRGELT